MSLPLVSIIMPIYNTEKYIAESIQSILDQTYQSFELICVDDGSTDRSVEIIRSFGDCVRLEVLSKNSGIAMARNTGIQMAIGRYIAFADADDIWKSQKLEKQMVQLSQEPALSISFCLIEHFISPDVPKEVQQMRLCPSGSMPGKISPTALIRREVFDVVGLLNPTFRVGEFVDWIARATEAGFQHGVVDEVLFLRRIHETNTGVVARPSRVDYVRVVKQALDRKRGISSS